ncbi:MAG: MarR family transcriptional regulator [Lachnospiraceae bacterium]
MEDQHLQLLMHQISHLSMQKSMQLLEVYDLKPGQAGILFVLNQHKGLSQKELSKKIKITPPSVTVAIRKMEDEGYILRTSDETDQRIIRLEVTEKGQNCIVQITSVLNQMEELLFANISEEEKLLFRRLLIQMRDNLTNCKELERAQV